MTALYDTVSDALLARLVAQCGDTFSYYSRRFLLWEQVVQMTNANQPVIRQPALFLFDGVGLGGGKTRYDPRQRATPTVRTLDKTIVIYARLPRAGPDSGTPDTGFPGGYDYATPGGTVFYPLIQSIETALIADDLSQGTLMLGGLVTHCWLEGDGVVITGETDPDGQGMATLPVRIMIP